MRKLLLPTPGHSLLLFVVWLLLNKSVSPGHILLGALLAILIPLLTNRLRNPHPGIRRPVKALLYLFRVLGDILVANLQVARLIIRPHMALRPSFVEVPLDISGDLPITVLASTITLTPGTVSADVSDDRSRLLLHVLHLEDEEELISTIKTRYEKPLKEIFAC
ncbi:monovalent cation/H+ antiporter subunit E [Marinobacterium nitratireducens]|uniref:Monovalent cation/H+ antiporter subunit E n=1 Tax=Marinobacterium nitratireducens TaxID=518897 RepID=A0A917Z817_9GAMM|nr:Na+/H+ antiporter subunit E [Marinobacterium nitratireducens]GGO77698.1 monovalent cation/H+ antiporter subunit E [Marinobacterium nitratireducens]